MTQHAANLPADQPIGSRTHTTSRQRCRRIAIAATFASVLALAGCGGSSGPGVEAIPLTNDGGGTSSTTAVLYTGPAPATDDVQRFKLSVWDGLAADNRCGSCHGTGGQAPEFVFRSDVNVAYQQVNPLVDLKSPATSLLVTKVGGGHNCWLASSQACADVVTRQIQAWAGADEEAVRAIALTPPRLRAPGESKRFPVSSGAFATTVHPVLTQYCAQCHKSDAAIPQSPYLAETDPDVSYEAARSKINLDVPTSSRLVLRLANEFHNCWSNCDDDGATMSAAITAFANGINTSTLDADMVTSMAVGLTDGIVASSGGRSDGNVIALWEFKAGSGGTAFDTSGVAPAMDLSLIGAASWVGGYGVQFIDGARGQATTTTSRKLYDQLRATGEYSVEAWAAPANVVQEGPARIVSYSAGTQARNFTLGQTLYNYDFLARTDASDGNGEPGISTPNADEVLQATLQHVVATFDPTNGSRLYVNGRLIDSDGAATAGSLNDWDDTFAFVIGNEVSGDVPWSGTLRLVAVHSRALSAEQVLKNFDAGVGERFFLLFGIGDVIGVDDAYILFAISQLDSFAYTFEEPRLITLGTDTLTTPIPIKGMRIGINGEEVAVGQAYARLDVLADPSNAAEDGIQLSPVGTIIGIDKSVDTDEFFLTFEQLGSATHVVIPAAAPPSAPPADLPEQSDIGFRTFAEINATMARVTGVPVATSSVAETFQTVLQQLPTVEAIDGFLASHQMAVTQLAIGYCNALVEDPTLASEFFASFNLDAPASSALSAGSRMAMIDPLIAMVSTDGLQAQPASAEIGAELDVLVDRLTQCGASCSSDRTRTVTKAVCAAVLGSGLATIQ